MKKITIVETIVILYVILFLYTAISKLMEYSIFKEQVATSPILAPVAGLTAIGVPLLEFLVTLLLVIPKWRLQGLYMSLWLMIAFTLYIIGIMLFHDQLPSSCGGVLQELSWTGHLIFNGAYTALATLGIRMERKIRLSSHEEMVSRISSITIGKPGNLTR
jgi:hypothetical protein